MGGGDNGAGDRLVVGIAADDVTNGGASIFGDWRASGAGGEKNTPYRNHRPPGRPPVEGLVPRARVPNWRSGSIRFTSISNSPYWILGQ